MNMITIRKLVTATLGVLLIAPQLLAETSHRRGMTTVRPRETDAVLTNPGMGFMTFQRFNGDDLNEGIGWTEGLPIDYQEFDGDLTNKDHPDTSLAYFRVAWCFVEPEKGAYNWEMLDAALDTAASRGQDLILRIMPHGSEENQMPPAWYLAETGDDPHKQRLSKWWLEPENPAYLKYFGGMVRELGRRYNGHPNLFAVDVSIVAFWGEGAGTQLLRDETKNALINAYLDAFPDTHLLFQPLNGDSDDPGDITRGTRVKASWPDGTRNEGPFTRATGFRFDCLGDLGFWKKRLPDWTHMTDIYPQHIILSGMQDAWKEAPISAEICGTFGNWKEVQGYGPEEVQYIFEQALKWHVSSFNAKSSPVPDEYKPLVDEWLKRMGYRFVLRKFEYPSRVRVNGKLPFTSWWENKGVAPCYDPYPLALRLRGADRTIVLKTDADIRKWLPGDALFNDAVFIPRDTPPGKYELEIAILDKRGEKPVIKLAIEGLRNDGWYPLSTIEVVDEPGLPMAPLEELIIP